MSDILMQYTKTLHITPTEAPLEVYFSDNDDAKAEKLVTSLKNSILIGLNIDGSAINRCLYEKDYDMLLSKISTTYPNTHVIILSLPHRRNEISHYLENKQFHNISLAYETKTIFEAMALVSKLNILITPDTSFIHIASALQVPLIGIYSGNSDNFNLWEPKNKIYKIVRSAHTLENSIEGFDKTIVLKYLDLLLKGKNNDS